MSESVNKRIAKNTFLPKTGVYVADILLSDKIYYGVTHIGTRPTLDNDSFISIETHIFDFSGDLYNEYVRIELVRYLREEKEFSSIDELKKQLKYDKSSII